MQNRAAYENYISLESFCSVALELERYGLRSASGPFDWCVSSFSGVIEAIQMHFSNFLEYENLYQHASKRRWYQDKQYGFELFHDFNDYQPLNSQLHGVREKYRRRIERFYTQIAQPTLFFRYIGDEPRNPNGRSAELEWIENNIDAIRALLKSFHEANEIVFIGNTGMESDSIYIYNVDKDEGDTVAREFVHKNKDLLELVSNAELAEKEKNLAFIRRKEKKKHSIYRRIRNKIAWHFRKSKAVYLHDKTV